MRLFINHAPVEAENGATLADILIQEGIAAEGIAVAIGNSVVPRSKWTDTYPEAEAKITVIRAVCGG